MGTFKGLVKVGILQGKEKCNLRGENTTPDGCWSLQNGELPQSHILCVEYKAAIQDLPKLIIDAFINKYGKIPNSLEFDEITREVIESMKIAVAQGRIDF